MDQREINHREWENPDNWSVGFYFSKKDSRALVPKRTPWMGWTLNLGSRAGALWMMGILVAIPIVMALALVLVYESR